MQRAKARLLLMHKRLTLGVVLLNAHILSTAAIVDANFLGSIKKTQLKVSIARLVSAQA